MGKLLGGLYIPLLMAAASDIFWFVYGFGRRYGEDMDFDFIDVLHAFAVEIPDPNLRTIAELGVTTGAPITVNEMATLTRLDAENAAINDLTGLEAGDQPATSKPYRQRHYRYIASDRIDKS